jgi:CheY-like chemotaxis protein/glycine cleavage system H lipoate-binding protein
MNAVNAAPRLLVVDDEPVVCQSCSRILEPEGFEVETITDSEEGLRLASERDYAAILLDIRIPGMDGLEFLERLRAKNVTVPVIIITGHSSIPSAAAAMRLGAADYIPKPFTPDEITAAVRRLIPSSKAMLPLAPAPTAQPWRATSDGFHFLDESWFQTGQDGTVRVGAFLSRDEVGQAHSVRLPRVGDTVLRGLPLAGLFGPGSGPRVVPAPISGEVIEVHQELADSPAALWEDPCTRGWIARIRPSQIGLDATACTPRTVVLANRQELGVHKWRSALVTMGCRVLVASTTSEVIDLLDESGSTALVVDAISFDGWGPALASMVNELFPTVKIVVVGDASDRREVARRGTRILYYAMEPVDNAELIEILCSIFKPADRPALPPRASALPASISRIRLTGQGGEVSLLVERDMLRQRDGLGQRLIHALLDGAYPVTTSLGSSDLTPLVIWQEAEACSRVVVLLCRDLGLLPGSLVRDVPSDLVDAVGRAAMEKVVTVSVQPPAGDSRRLAFDVRTTDALAEHIARLMTLGA